MANRQYSNNSFLPSGAFDANLAAPYNFTSHSPMISPSGKAPIPRSVPHNIPSIWQQQQQQQISQYSSPQPLYRTSSPSITGQQYTAISPPISRSGSTDENSATLIEDWRRYTHNLREQFKGERAHLLADRARADEIMAEEREINDQERAIFREEVNGLRSENAQLHAIVAAYRSKYGDIEVSPSIASAAPSSIFGGIRSPPGVSFLNRPITSPLHRPSIPSSIDGTGPSFDLGQPRLSSRSTPETVIQETGRQENGPPVWAPVSGPTARTFDHNEAVDMDMDHVTMVESGLRVPSREFRPEDFQVLSPEERKAKDVEASEAGSIAGDGVPGQVISPQLDGVILKESAVAPAFKINSPTPSGTPLHSPPSNGVRKSPPTQSNVIQKDDTEKESLNDKEPQIESSEHDTVAPKESQSTDPPLDDTTNKSHQLSRHSSEGRQSSAELLKADPDERLTANAGFTPVHSRSVSKVDSDFAGSGYITPTHNGRAKDHNTSFDSVYPPVAVLRPQVDGPIPEDAIIDDAIEDDGDRALDSPLAMGHRANRGDSFVLQLDERLAAIAEEQARRGSILSVSTIQEEVADLGGQDAPPVALRVARESSSVTSPEMQDIEDEVRPLRIKPSLNFGRPFGH